MGKQPTDKDLEIHAAIDEYHEATAEQSRIHEETARWQREHPQPEKPQLVESMAEVEEYERKSKEWGKPYREQLKRRQDADLRVREAVDRLKRVLPHDYGYRYKGSVYQVVSTTMDLHIDGSRIET